MLSVRTKASTTALVLAALAHTTVVPAPLDAAQPPRGVRAEAPSRPTPLASTRELISRLPASVRVAVAIDNAAAQRVSGPGRSLWAFIQESKLLQRTQGAWNELAAVLKLTPEQAFDELLGRRAVLVLVPSDSGGLDRWALLSEVSPKVEARIRQSLAPAPRSIERGRPILSLERGAFELATTSGRPRRIQPPESPADEMIVLAPSENAALFDELLAVLSGDEPPRTLGRLPGWDRASTLAPGDVFVWCTDPGGLGPLEPGESATPKPEEFAAFSATLSPRGWDAQFVGSPCIALWDSPHAAPLPGAAATIERGAMFSYSGPLPRSDEKGARQMRQLAALIWPSLPDKLLRHLGPTVIFALHAQAQGLTCDTPTQMAISIAVRSDDPGGTAPAADEFMSWAIRRGVPAGRSSYTNATVSEQDFSGLRPDEPRTLERTAERSLPGQDAAASPESPDAAVSWACVPDAATADDREPGHDVGPRGWWLVGVALGTGPRDTAAGRLDLMRPLALSSQTDPAGVVARMTVRPALIMQTITPRAPGDLPETLRALRWFELISSESFTPNDGVIAGRVSVEMASPPAQPR